MMRKPEPSSLRWLPPRHVSKEGFEHLKPQLEEVLLTPQQREVYSANSRSIYLTHHPQLGAVAIKELRFEKRKKRWQAASVKRHLVLCEFNVAASFGARGGLTPRVYGAALEYRGIGLSRVFILLEWLDAAETLSEAMRRWSDSAQEENVRALARALVSGAERGLVHGRHSSENILITEPLAFYTIDFSHAQLFKAFQPQGFMLDVARIGARLTIEDACPPSTVHQLFSAVTEAAPAGTVDDRQMAAEYENVFRHSKQRQRLERNRRTFWRGLPFRL